MFSLVPLFFVFALEGVHDFSANIDGIPDDDAWETSEIERAVSVDA